MQSKKGICKLCNKEGMVFRDARITENIRETFLSSKNSKSKDLEQMFTCPTCAFKVQLSNTVKTYSTNLTRKQNKESGVKHCMLCRTRKGVLLETSDDPSDFKSRITKFIKAPYALDCEKSLVCLECLFGIDACNSIERSVYTVLGISEEDDLENNNSMTIGSVDDHATSISTRSVRSKSPESESSDVQFVSQTSARATRLTNRMRTSENKTLKQKNLKAKYSLENTLRRLRPLKKLRVKFSDAIKNDKKMYLSIPFVNIKRTNVKLGKVHDDKDERRPPVRLSNIISSVNRYDDNQYLCQICDKSFLIKCDYLSHLLRHEKVESLVVNVKKLLINGNGKLRKKKSLLPEDTISHLLAKYLNNANLPDTALESDNQNMPTSSTKEEESNSSTESSMKSKTKHSWFKINLSKKKRLSVTAKINEETLQGKEKGNKRDEKDNQEEMQQNENKEKNQLIEEQEYDDEKGQEKEQYIEERVEDNDNKEQDDEEENEEKDNKKEKGNNKRNEQYIDERGDDEGSDNEETIDKEKGNKKEKRNNKNEQCIEEREKVDEENGQDNEDENNREKEQGNQKKEYNDKKKEQPVEERTQGSGEEQQENEEEVQNDKEKDKCIEETTEEKRQGNVEVEKDSEEKKQDNEETQQDSEDTEQGNKEQKQHNAKVRGDLDEEDQCKEMKGLRHEDNEETKLEREEKEATNKNVQVNKETDEIGKDNEKEELANKEKSGDNKENEENNENQHIDKEKELHIEGNETESTEEQNTDKRRQSMDSDDVSPQVSPLLIEENSETEVNDKMTAESSKKGIEKSNGESSKSEDISQKDNMSGSPSVQSMSSKETVNLSRNEISRELETNTMTTSDEECTVIEDQINEERGNEKSGEDKRMQSTIEEISAEKSTSEESQIITLEDETDESQTKLLGNIIERLDKYKNTNKSVEREGSPVLTKTKKRRMTSVVESSDVKFEDENDVIVEDTANSNKKRKFTKTISLLDGEEIILEDPCSENNKKSSCDHTVEASEEILHDNYETVFQETEQIEDVSSNHSDETLVTEKAVITQVEMLGEVVVWVANTDSESSDSKIDEQVLSDDNVDEEKEEITCKNPSIMTNEDLLTILQEDPKTDNEEVVGSKRKRSGSPTIDSSISKKSCIDEEQSSTKST